MAAPPAGGEVDTENYGEPPRHSQPAEPETDSSWTDAPESPVARMIAREVTRGLMGALLGKRPRRRTRGWF